MKKKIKSGEKGITLIELLVALVIGGIIISAIYRIFVSQGRAYVIQDQVAETQQNIRSAMEILLRDLRMAGFNGDNTPLDPYIIPGANTITIFYERNGAIRQTSYSIDGNSRLMRNQIPPEVPPSEENGDPILTNVEALNFLYGVDTDTTSDGVVNSWVDAGDVGISKVIAIQVRLEASPTQVNPDLNVVTPRALQSTVTLRNLCLK